MSNWDALKKRLDGLQRPTTTFTICQDPEARQRLYEAKAGLRAAETTLAGVPDDDEAGQAVAQTRVEVATMERDAAQKAFDKVAIVLTFEALERKRFEDLLKAHPPEELDEADGADFAMESFGPALIEAASKDGIPADYARHLLDTWSPADAQALFTAAWSVQHTERADLGKG
ncbi:hypothetical protein ACFW9D_05595 [Streptomyces sp. NPDC059524]|uniref:hypothetical protein n=1 Tax=Streptomyces sp. NPDC059524 TaxID=3346856 RepID=UPI0036760A7D